MAAEDPMHGWRHHTHLKGVKVAAYHGMVFACFSVLGPFDLGLLPLFPPLSREEASHPIFHLLGFRARPSFPPLEGRKSEAQLCPKKASRSKGGPLLQAKGCPTEGFGFQGLGAPQRAWWPTEGCGSKGLLTHRGLRGRGFRVFTFLGRINVR